jgi:hypothetical protein
LQVGTKQVMGLDGILEHVPIGRDLLNIIFERGEDF